MKRIFHMSWVCWLLLEFLMVYLMMPLPGSQESSHVSLAYMFFVSRWWWRTMFALVLVVTFAAATRNTKVWALLGLLVSLSLIGYINFEMTAESMFRPMGVLKFGKAAQNAIDSNRLVIGVAHQGIAKAYPVMLLGYHHQVMDRVGTLPVWVTYCTVCRSGRVFRPVLDGEVLSFRLVGMDCYNALFEDTKTKSWWQQVSGEAVTGTLRGKQLEAVPFVQMALKDWLKLHPDSDVLQPDATFAAEYASLEDYEGGRREGRLTRRDTLPWQTKSWVVGLTQNGESKAYDWSTLQQHRVTHDIVGMVPVVIVVASDGLTLTAFERASPEQQLELRPDGSLADTSGRAYTLGGLSRQAGTAPLRPIQVYQQYWHSWQTWHPNTKLRQAEEVKNLREKMRN